MKVGMSLSRRETKETDFLFVQEKYPHAKNIINIQSEAATNCEVVTWQFANGESVQLLMYSPEEADLLYVSPAIVLPDEAENGHFFTATEIEHFFNQIKYHQP